jgi:hypothetical protein
MNGTPTVWHYRDVAVNVDHVATVAWSYDKGDDPVISGACVWFVERHVPLVVLEADYAQDLWRFLDRRFGPHTTASTSRG